MPETLTDEQILGLDDSPEVSTSETSTPVETPSQETAEQPPLSPTTEKSETLPAQKPTEKPQDKTQQAKPTDQSQDAQTFEQLFPAGIEQAREVHAKATELDRADAAFTNGDYQGMAQTFEQVFGDNPHGCVEALWMGRRFLEQRAPQESAAFSRFVVSEELGKQGVWDWLERVYESAQKVGARDTLELLNQGAGFFHGGYALGPQSPEIQAASWQNYTNNVRTLLRQNVDADIKRAFGAEFSAVLPQFQEDLMTAGRLAVRDLLQKDRDLELAWGKLASAYTINDGVKLFLDVMDPRIRAIVPGIVQHLRAQYGDLFKQAAPIPRKANSQPAPTSAEKPPSSLAEARARGMGNPEILRTTQSELEQADADNVLGLDEANQMRPEDVLASPRRADLTRPEKRNRKVSRADVLRSRVPFSEILDGALEVADQ
jgi:hypothetical protein